MRAVFYNIRIEFGMESFKIYIRISNTIFVA
jgi:hypothetical protein